MPKKTKAIKLTDRNKAWLRKAKPSVYEIESRETNKIILIVCEGQTEKLYFESFPVLTLTVEAIDLRGQSKLKLIEVTEAIVKNSTSVIIRQRELPGIQYRQSFLPPLSNHALSPSTFPLS